MANLAIDVRGLKKSYKTVPVLKDVQFSVRKGSIFALLGTNGAGKTTTINILTTLLKADDGVITVDGFNVNNQASQVRKRISLTGQFAAVDGMLTARENLIMVAELRHVKQPGKTAEDLLRDFSLLDAADRRAVTFSGGMRRRLDIAMSLIGNPSVIFLDEPTTGLDPQSRNAMWEKIRQMAASGATVFLTTQYLEEADQLADDIAILHKGTIVARGTAPELKEMLPASQIELTFATRQVLEAAQKLFASAYTVVADKDSLSLMISANNDTSHVARIFAELGKHNIEVTGFTQHLPTLDDVFMKIVNEEEEVK